jgi:hypothetical protein
MMVLGSGRMVLAVANRREAIPSDGIGPTETSARHIVFQRWDSSETLW